MDWPLKPYTIGLFFGPFFGPFLARQKSFDVSFRSRYIIKILTTWLHGNLNAFFCQVSESFMFFGI